MGQGIGLAIFVAGLVLGLAVAMLGARMLGARWVPRSQQTPPPPPVMDVHAVFGHVTDGVVLLDNASNIILMNQSAASLLGLRPGPHLADELRDTFEVLTPEGEPIPRDRWPSALAVRGEFLNGCELQIRRRDTGHTAIVKLSTAPVKDAANVMVQVLLIYRDITERAESEVVWLRLSAIVESSEDAIIGKDDCGIVTSWNRGAERIFGYTAGEMIGGSLKRLLPPDRQSEEEEILARIKRGETVDHIETTRVRKDGASILISLTISPIRAASGKIVGASKIARDITAQRRMERQVQQRHKMEAIGQLTGGIAHDFNNLLGVVIGNLDLLEPLLERDSQAAKRTATAQKAALRGADLTRRLLAFSCNEELHPTLTSVASSILSTLELASRGLGPEIRIVTQVDESLPLVMVDHAGLDTLLLNLILNARDAMPEGGVLTLSTQLTLVDADQPPTKVGELQSGSYVSVTVSDSGHGMSRATLDRVFEPFFTTKPRGRGTGLGLAMAYGFLKQSGGTVRIYSELGHGTSVSFYLPVPRQTEERRPRYVPQLPGRAAKGCTVLIVDDEEDLLEIAVIYIEEMVCKALPALDGATALEILASPAPIDVMLTDIIMPGGISGDMLAQRARVLRPDMKIVYCSGFPADALAERSSMLVDGPLLRKPYQRADIQAFVHRALGNTQKVAG